MHRITRSFPLSTGLVSLALLLACGQEPSAPTTPELAIARTNEFTECTQTQSWAKAWIGPSGGTITAGNHALRVPAGALSVNTLITMQAPADSISRVRFGPEGLRFNKRYPASLTTRYGDCQVQPTSQQRIVQVDDSFKIIEEPPSTDDPLRKQVEAQLLHFSDYVLMSTYAVAY